MTCQPGVGPAIVVPPVAEIDLTNCEQVYDRLYTVFASGAVVVIADFTTTWFCDCGSLRRLLTVQMRAAAQGGQLRLVIPSGSPVRRVAYLIGLNRQLPVYSSVREAAAWMPRPDDQGEVGGPAGSRPASRGE